MNRLRSARNRKTLLIVALLAIAAALSWLSWHIGSPLMTEIHAKATSVKARGLQVLVPSGGPVQRLPMP